MQFPKYVKIKILGDEENKDIFVDPNDEIIIEEKMDGANTRIYIYNNKLYFGSRNISDLDLESDNFKNFRRSAEFVIDKLKDKDLSKYNNLILFGETMVRHTLDYDWAHIPSILMFDIYDMNQQRYLNYKEKTAVFNELELPIVPLVKITNAKELSSLKIDDNFVPKSQWRDGQAEGVVFKNYKKQIFAKYVRERFKEKSREVFGGSKKYAKDDSEKVVAIYCLNPRIEKNILNLLDEGKELNMKLMSYLPKQVWNDIIEEEGKEILNSNYVIDLRKVRKLIAKRCVNVLKQMIVNNTLISKGDLNEKR